MSVMSSGKPHQTCGPGPVLWWLGPDLVHHVSDCVPLPLCLRHRGTLWDLQWLPLPACERRYSTGCFTQGLGAPTHDYELSWPCMHAYMCMGMCRAGFTAPGLPRVCGGLVAPNPLLGSLGQPDRSAVVPSGMALQELSRLVLGTLPAPLVDYPV